MRTGATLIFMVCFCCTTLAQLRYGIKAGLNLSDVVINNVTDNPDAESDFRMKTGVHAGVFADLQLSPRVALSAEVLYSNKGVKAIRPIHLHYISVPVLIRYSITEKLLAGIGPELGYLVAAKSKFGNVSSVWDNKIDLGLDVDMEYRITSNVSAGIRFGAGISNVIRDAGSTPAGEKIRYQNRTLQLSIGYCFRTIEE